MSKFKTNEDYFAFSKRLVVIPTQDIKKLLQKHKIRLPQFVHTFLLKETIRAKVFEERLYETYTDELQFRLRGYDDFSIYPLEKLIETYQLDFELARYKELLFDFLFINAKEIGYKNSFIGDLEQLQHNYTVDLETMKYSDFCAVMEDIFYPVDGYLDGLLLRDWTEELLASYTLGDLKALGKKYGVSVPRRINKAKLIEILSAKFKLTEDESELLAKKSVLDLEIYAKEKDFKISIDLKKKDMIEYIEFSLGMYHKPVTKDEFSYDIPLTTQEEAVTDDLEEMVPVEEVVTDEIVIPVEEEIEEEVVIPEPIEEEKIPEPEPEVFETPVSNEKPAFEETKEPEVKPEPKPVDDHKPLIQAEPDSVDESLLSKEEKELLDEKINQIIKKYYKKRRRRRITWIILITLIVLVVGFAGYAYYYYTSYSPGNLPFGIPVFW